MTWTIVEQIVKMAGWFSAVAVAVFLLGQFVYRLTRGEMGNLKLSPMQQIAVDLASLSDMVKREIAEVKAQIGTQYTEVAQKVNGHHVDIRELKEARNNEYERLVQKFYSKDMIDRRFAESEKDRELIHAKLDAITLRCDKVIGARCD